MKETEELVSTNALDLIRGDYQQKYGFNDEIKNSFELSAGLSEEKIKAISSHKQEPDWMLALRLKAYQYFLSKPMPSWGADLSGIEFNKIKYFVSATDKKEKNWNQVPEKIKSTFEKLGIPQAERKFLAGVASQYESEVIYHRLKDKWTKLGVIFEDTDTALQKYPELFQKYFNKIIPYTDNKFSALNTAVWSGGSFIYVPKGLKVTVPLQAYFRINAQNMGQFERTLIIVDEGADVHYIEGCTAPIYSSDSLHSAVVEIYVERNAHCRYTTIQNWSDNVYNLVTKRAAAKRDASMEWVDCNLGSKVTMKYPSVYLLESGAHGEVKSLAFAGKGQQQDTGAKMIHRASNTSSLVVSKSIAMNGGRTSYRGLVSIPKSAHNCKNRVNCDALIMDDISQTDTYPTNIVSDNQASLSHEATISRLDQEQMFYLTSKGLTPEQAVALLVAGFVEPIVKELPLEYAAELNALLQISFAGSVG